MLLAFSHSLHAGCIVRITGPYLHKVKQRKDVDEQKTNVLSSKKIYSARAKYEGRWRREKYETYNIGSTPRYSEYSGVEKGGGRSRFSGRHHASVALLFVKKMNELRWRELHILVYQHEKMA